jgi:hypothetical protein
MPFYRRLRQDLPKGAALLAVFPRREPDPRTFLAARSVQVDQVSSSDSLKQIGVTSTPTLLLVDEHGTVKRAWVGAQAEATHEDIVASVAREL